MRIGIDVSMIDKNKAGIGYYAFSLVKALNTIDSVNEYFLFTYNKELLNELQLSSNFKIIEVPGSGNLKWMVKCLSSIKELNLNHFLSPSNLFWGCVLNNCTTVIHDIGQILYPKFFYKKGNLIYKFELNILLRKKGIVIVPSNSVKRELISTFKFIKSEVFVIKEGLHEWVFKKYTDEEKANVVNKYNLPENYILSVGTLEPRKNLVQSILGFKEFLKLNPSFKYLIVGKKGWFYDEILEVVQKSNLEDNVKFLGYVPDSDLPVIYDNSQLLILLSHYEGFGLPLIEATARNVPVLASNIDVFNELDINSLNISLNSTPEEIGIFIDKAIAQPVKVNDSFFDTYSWKSTAQEFINIWASK